MTVRGYLPPEGTQNVHRKPHKYLESQGAHKVRGTVIYSPEEVILTGSESSQTLLEQVGLQEINEEVAQSALEVWQDGEDVAPLIEEYKEAEAGEYDPEQVLEQEPESGEYPEETEESTEDPKVDLPPIPEDLEDLNYNDELYPLAQAHGVVEEADSKATEDLIEALEDARGS